MGKLRNLTGQRFGRLVVCRRDMIRIGDTHGAYWICKCDCGVGCIVNSGSLVRGSTKSCGCIRSERGRETIKIYGNRLGRKPKKSTAKS